jgi:hypothetical protein
MANFCTHGNDSYSYDTCIRTVDDNGRIIQNVTKYSKTTSKHQNEAFRYDSKLSPSRVDDVPRGATAQDLRTLAQEG